MSEIEVFQSRIMVAMDRLAAGVETIAGGSGTEAAVLKEALDEEKTVNAQLTERVRVLAERQDQALAAMEAKSSQAAARIEALDLEMQRLRQANEELQNACETLRAANEEGVGEPHLINKAMVAQLDAMKAMRRTEIAEADEIIAAMTPLLTEAAQAPSQETSDA
ncbi:MAG: hypothetical protein AAF636_15075 [Pseudomonadota bacterium]